MAQWPEGLPKFSTPVSHQVQDQTIRTQMDAGPDKVRRRSTVSIDHYQIPVRMTGAEYHVLLIFHRVTCGGGALSFQMEDPMTGDEADFRFLSPPSAQIIRGHEDPGKRLLNVTLELEKL